MPGSVIVSSARTPIGRLSGALAGFSAMDLGGVAIKAALDRGAVGAEQIDYVVMGQVLQAGQGQITARQAALKAGIPMTVPAITINKVCLSGLNALYLADQMVQAGDAEVVVAGGMESMTNAPYLLPKARSGYRMGNGELVDALIQDGLWCAFDAVHMGSGTERYTGAFGGITREAQDDLAAKSHDRSRSARATRCSSKRTKEFVPAPRPNRSGG
jgi:acetyl-CoA C-acetyltransferase